MLRDNNSVVKTFLVAIVLCLVCSFIVAAAAVGLKERIRANKNRFRMSNVLEVAGFTAEEIAAAGGVEKVFADNFRQQFIQLDTGAEASETLATLMGVPVEELPSRFDPVKMSKATGGDLATPFANSAENIAGLVGGRENFGSVYLKVDSAGNVEKYIFPIRGAGLWSTLLGFIALEPDLQTVAGLTFYEHGETPGLGGEVENPDWKASWKGKLIYAVDDGAIDRDEVKLRVVKGEASDDDLYGIDGLSGATITSNGVSNLIAFWMGPRGYGSYIKAEKQRRNADSATQTTGAGS